MTERFQCGGGNEGIVGHQTLEDGTQSTVNNKKYSNAEYWGNVRVTLLMKPQ